MMDFDDLLPVSSPFLVPVISEFVVIIIGSTFDLSSWLLFVGPAMLVLIVFGWAIWSIIGSLARHNNRIRREREMVKALRTKNRQAAIDAIINRAMEQHVAYQLGIINNVPEMVRDGVYGEYQPVALEAVA